jgi:benzodiazapine receptor
MMRAVLIHAAFIAGVALIGTVIGTSTVPGDWYAGLVKPWFSPPNWLFGPVWGVLYLMIGWVGARKFLYGGALALWIAQMTLNFIWSPLFFGLHMPAAALLVISLMWITIAVFIQREWARDRLSAALFLPYLAWVTFAGALNAAIVTLN